MNFAARMLLFICMCFGFLPGKEAEPCVVVIFGATGDLTARKLAPALYHLNENTVLVGFARGEHTNDSFRNVIGEALRKFCKSKETVKLETFTKRIIYNRSDFGNDLGYENLKRELADIDSEYGTCGNRIFYLSTQPSYFATIIQKLNEHELIYGPDQDKWSRVVIEKPFGRNLQSALELQAVISKNLDESQVYRMDHYLGKEGVQNILSFRFENGSFEPYWNNQFIEHVQIMMSEEIGIGTRGRLWEETGAVRDFFQNHLMQLLALVAMERPLNAEQIHQTKIDVLNAVLPVKQIIRGQYGAGQVKGESMKGYLEEANVAPDSTAETFIAAALFIDNPRWKNVPFYVRGGKRLPKSGVEIQVKFKNGNLLTIHVQPSTQIVFNNSSESKVIEIPKKTTLPEAYENLLLDCMRGDDSRFVKGEEQLIAWKIVEPLLSVKEVMSYEAGSWGPSASEMLLNELKINH